jgi:hypothetical protein
VQIDPARWPGEEIYFYCVPDLPLPVLPNKLSFGVIHDIDKKPKPRAYIPTPSPTPGMQPAVLKTTLVDGSLMQVTVKLTYDKIRGVINAT